MEEPGWKLKTGEIEIVKAVRAVLGNNARDNVREGADVATAKKYTEDQTAVKSGNDLSQLDTTNDPLFKPSKDESEEEEEEDSEDEGDEESSTLADRLTALEANEEKDTSTSTKNTKGKSKESGSTSLLTKEFDDMSLKTPESFTLVLAQSLKTNDHALLESLLTSHNEENIKISVQHLESSQAVLLLERLADKIAKSPGRAAQLMVWIKWTLIAHGGYLVQVPNLAKSLSSLHLTLSNKVGMLPRLLTLQGRVEMLRTQLQMRREIAEHTNGANRKAIVNSEADDDSDVDSEVNYVEDENMIIVNGEEDYDEDDESEEDEDDEEEDDIRAGNDFIEFEAEESEDDEEDYSGKKGKTLFKQDEDYDMSDVEAEGIEKLDVPDASDNDEETTTTKSSKRKAGGKSNTRKSLNGSK